MVLDRTVLTSTLRSTVIRSQKEFLEEKRKNYFTHYSTVECRTVPEITVEFRTVPEITVKKRTVLYCKAYSSVWRTEPNSTIQRMLQSSTGLFCTA